jgi:hypothetical protein
MKALFLFLSFAFCLSGCATHGLEGEYVGRSKYEAGRHWSICLQSDGTFLAMRRFDTPRYGPDSTIELGDESYRGKWRLESQALILTREDGKEERLSVDTVLGSHVLRPARQDQPVLYWSETPAYD